MAPRTLLTALCTALGAVAPAAAVQSLLHAHAARRQGASRSSVKKVQRVEGVLRSRTAELRRALWDELGLEPYEPVTPALAYQAANRLAQEADYLAAEDDIAASLLHDYARSAFVPVLAMEPEMPQELRAPIFVQQPAADPDQLATVESSETVLQQDAEGRLVRTTRHCRGGTCMTQTEEVAPPEEAEPQDGMPEDMEVFQAEEIAPPEADYEGDWQDVLGMPVDTEDEATLGDAVGDAIDAVGDAVRIASRTLGKDLKRALQDAGMPPLGAVMKKVMNSTLGKSLQDIAKSLSVENVTDTSEGLAHAVQDFVGGLSSGGALADAESVSSVTTVEDGHVVTRTRRCRQGQCTDTVEEGDAAEGQAAEGQAAEGEPSEHAQGSGIFAPA